MTTPSNRTAACQTSPNSGASSNRRLALAWLLALGWLAPSNGIAAPGKAEQTPCFWQRDPQAGFENGGSNYCAPVAVGDGLIYLASARGFDGLVARTGHQGQVALVAALAKEMGTDPAKGTSPDQILSGLLAYARKRDYSFKRLELATWRKVSKENQRRLIGTKPGLRWMSEAVEDPDAVVLFNFGWYEKEEGGRHVRRGGHWVDVVGTGPAALQFDLHNPALKPELQRADTRITLAPVEEGFVFTDGTSKPAALAGYYQARGPGLPFDPSKIAAAVLDAVAVFEFEHH